jgi:DNA-binding transcriptional MerR regulator
MSDPLLTIGELAARAQVPVRTVRFWSDEGLIPVSTRSGAGYRLYGADAIVRLDLVRSLRDLGVGLSDIGEILRRTKTIAAVAQTHVDAVDAQIRVLRIQRSIWRLIAQKEYDPEELSMINRLATLSAQERQRILDDFVTRAFDGIPSDAPGAHIADRMKKLPAKLPEDPSDAQVEAWLELAELLGDPAFASRVREMAVAGASPPPAAEPPAPAIDPARVIEEGRAALASGVEPRSAAARPIVDRLVDPSLPTADRVRLADSLATFTDARVERYWQLLGVLNGWPPMQPSVPAFAWLIEALRADS